VNSHRRHLIALAHPVYFSLLASVAAGIINTVWVSRLGGPAVAAVAVATNTENVLLGIALVFASGTTVLVAHARGAGNPGAVGAAVRGGWALCAVITPLVATGGFLLREPLARSVLGGDGPALPRGGAPLLLRVTLLGTAVQLPLARALSGLGLPGICLALAVAMALQCAVLLRLARRQEGVSVSWVRVA
jgi:Na+-driven multidrug efflux pump